MNMLIPFNIRSDCQFDEKESVTDGKDLGNQLETWKLMNGMVQLSGKLWKTKQF